MRPRVRSARGFTLVEVLVVIMVVAILAMIVIPKVLGASREARESQLRANLHDLRTALALFNAHCGDWPATLDDLIAPDGTALVGGNGVSIPPDCYQGPYLIPCPTLHLPVDPFTNATDWAYQPTVGTVCSSSAQTGSDGSPYSSW